MIHLERIKRLERHLMEHPLDYQSKISLMVKKSEYMVHRKKEKQIGYLREVAKYKKEGLHGGK